ncbi:hypothetical protein L7F22_034470 [Adiantum nelumboides]|nr:hypothetical protein [Adiantum nelumboides]
MEDAPKNKKKGKPRGPSYKLKSNIELATDLKKVFEERILNSKVDMTLSDILGIAKREFHEEIINSFSAEMPLPVGADMVMHSQVVPDEDAFGTEVADSDKLAHIVHVLSAFGSLMSDLLVSRPDLAYAIGAFAVGVVSRAMTDTGIMHSGALQVITRYLQ